MKTLRFFMLIVSVPVVLFFLGCGNRGSGKPVSAEKGAPVKIEVAISGMFCTGCEQTIQTNVSKLEGVNRVAADFKTGRAVVDFYSGLTDTAEIRRAVAASGYKVTGFNPVTPGDTLAK